MTVYRVLFCCWFAMAYLVALPALAQEPATEPESQAAAVPEEPAKKAGRHASGYDANGAWLVEQQPGRVRWAGEGTARFALMETEALGAETRGAVLVVTDAGQSPAEGLAGQLHRYLPARGWHVMSVGLPVLAESVDSSVQTDPGENQGPDAENSADAPAPATRHGKSTAGAVAIDLAAAGDGNNANDRLGLTARQRIDVALGLVAERGAEPVLLIGIGLGAKSLTQVLADAGNGPAAIFGGPAALVWVRPRFNTHESVAREVPVAASQVVASWPVLDVVGRVSQHRPDLLRETALRQVEGARYRQDRLVLDGVDAQALAYRIHSWAVSQLEQ